MSGPFVYRPPTEPATYDSREWQQTPYDYMPRSTTPFIPPTSPYSRPSSSHPSPNRGAVPLPRPTMPDPYVSGSPYDAGYDAWARPRERRPSWHSNEPPWPGMAPPPFSAPAYDGSAASISAGVPGYRQRRHSFNSGAGYPYDAIQIHQFLNAEVPRPDFFFDLASPSPEPLLVDRGQTFPLPGDILTESATHPALTRLRIVVDGLPPDWVIDMAVPVDRLQYSGFEPPPITVWAVLQQVWRQLSRQVTHVEFGSLSPSQVDVVRRAFTKRCRISGGGYEGYEAERAKGVRRVDFLGNRTRFVGLLRAGREDGFDVMRAVTTEAF